jgi:hypothetical protein
MVIHTMYIFRHSCAYTTLVHSFVGPHGYDLFQKVALKRCPSVVIFIRLQRLRSILMHLQYGRSASISVSS